MIAQAQSGTGKTATFSISILQRIDENEPSVQALVMAPTRELAQQVGKSDRCCSLLSLVELFDSTLFQIQKVMCALGDYMNIKVHACIGGTSIRDDQRKLESGVHVVVGTPGRVNDMINRSVLRTFLAFCFAYYS